MIYAILTEDGLDQMVESKEQVEREKKWLKSMGFTVRIKTFTSWQEAEAWEDRQ